MSHFVCMRRYSYGPRANESGVGDEQTDLYLIMYHKTGTLRSNTLLPLELASQLLPERFVLCAEER